MSAPISERATGPVLAVDGGGTRCRIALDDGTTRLSIETGPANVTSDYDRAVATLCAGLAEMAAAWGPVDLVPTYMGLAGMTGPDLAARLAADLPLAHLRIAEDRDAAVRGALGCADGALALCGTGAFIALQHGGAVRFAGGWGPALGDVTSGFWLGRRALIHTLSQIDGLEASSALAARLTKRIGGRADLIVFANRASQAEMASLAPDVLAAMDASCDVATGIVAEGAAHIEHMLHALGWRAETPLCLGGGVGPAYRSFLSEPVARLVRDPQGSPLDGALALARDFAADLDP